MANNISPAEIQKNLQGVKYPASKDDLLNKARENGASDDVVKAIDRLPDGEFGGPQDVMKAMGSGGDDKDM